MDIWGVNSTPSTYLSFHRFLHFLFSYLTTFSYARLCLFDTFSAVRRCRVSAPKTGGSFPKVRLVQRLVQTIPWQELEMTEATSGKSLPPRPRGKEEPNGGRRKVLIIKKCWKLSSAAAVEIRLIILYRCCVKIVQRFNIKTPKKSRSTGSQVPWKRLAYRSKSKSSWAFIYCHHQLLAPLVWSTIMGSFD